MDSRVVTLTNTGSGPSAVVSAAVKGSSAFSLVSTTCSTALATGDSCAATVGFAAPATDYAPQTGSLVFKAGSDVIAVALSGASQAPSLTYSTASLDLGHVAVGASSSVGSFTLSNPTTSPAYITGLGVSENPTEFAQSNNCGGTLAAGATCTVNVTMTPSGAGTRLGAIGVVSAAGSQMVTLSGTGHVLSASLSTPSFPGTPVGTVSTAVATLTNTSGIALGVTVPSAESVTGAGYSFASTTCGASLAVGASCSATVRFSPTTTSPTFGALNIVTGAGAQTASFGSTGIQGFAAVNSSSLSFAAQQVNSTSAAQVVTVTNTGSDTLTFTGVGIALGGSDFAQSNNCGSVPVGGTCTVNVAFTPSTNSNLSGTLSFTHNGGGIANVDLYGTGHAQSATLSTPPFSATPVGSSSTAVATLSNTGFGALSVTAPTAGSVTGAGYSLVSTTCGTSVAVGASCSTTVRFSPTTTSPVSGSLDIATGAGTQTASLGSTGIQGFAAVNPASLSFGAQQISSTSAVQVVTVTNTGSDTLTFTGVGIALGGSDFAQTNNCGSVPVGGTCMVNVAFTPSANSNRSGTLSFTHNGGGIANVDLSGTGQAQSASLTTVNFGGVNVGSAQTFAATLTNTGIGTLTVTPPAAESVLGSEFSFVSTTCGSTLSAGANCTTTVRFSPVNGGAKSGSLVIGTGAATQTAALSGTGNQAVLAFSSPSSTTINWGSRQVGGSYASSLVTLTNSGNVPASSLVLTPTSAWTLTTNTCGTTLNAASSCTFVMMFNPTAVQAYSGAVTATAAVSAVTNQVSMAGSGVGQSATLSTPSFPPTAVGSSSTAVATLSNTGLGPLTVSMPTGSATSGAAYTFVSTDCASSLAVGNTCSVTVRFSPTSTTSTPGALSIGTGAGPQTVTLSSTGIQGYASMSPGSLSFGTSTVGSSSGVQTITVTNTGTNTLTFTGAGIAAGGSDFAQTNSCGSVPVGGTCTVNVNFTPSTTGALAGTLAFTHNGGGIATVSLSGFGQQVVLSADMPSQTIGNVTLGSSASRTYTVSNTGNVAASLAYSSLSAPVTRSGTCSTTLAANASCTVILTYAPTVASGASSYTVTVSAGGTSVALTAIGAGYNPGQPAITSVAYNPGQPYVAPTAAVTGQPYIAPVAYNPGQPYIAPVAYNPGQPYIASTPYNPGQPYIAATPYNPGQPYVAPSGWVAPTSSGYSGGTLVYQSYSFVSMTPGPYSGYPAFVSGGSAGSNGPDGTVITRYEGFNSGGNWYLMSTDYVVSGATPSGGRPGYYTNPGQPYIAPTAAVVGQPYIAPTAAVAGQPYIAPTPAVAGQPYIAPTPAVAGQPYIAPVAYNPGQPYIAPTPAVTGQPYIAPTGGM